MSNVETKLTQELPESVLATLAEIGEEINASLNLDRVLSKMATLIKRLIDYEIFTVMLLDERSQMLVNRFAVGYSQEMMENWLSNSHQKAIAESTVGTMKGISTSARIIALNGMLLLSRSAR